ncbi:MAG: hypothetical protein WC427_03550 [Candidatus Paceibacterota bacterium]|jgi:hypothetical protein
MLPNQVISYNQLKKEFPKERIEKMSASLKLFPTPFKGIYYIPNDEEKKGWFIENPKLVLKKSVELFLKNNKFYFSCSSAEEFFGMEWKNLNELHIVNEKLSRKINLKKRIERNKTKKTYRSKKIGRILSFYGNTIIFHKVKSIKTAKTKSTPYGVYATKRQIEKDKKRFNEKYKNTGPALVTKKSTK